tara:strand:+ start:727 stop:933 length:207 start_codon:yes stop_codon:yes gene_type:complete
MLKDSGLSDSQFVKAQETKREKLQSQKYVIDEETRKLELQRFKDKIENGSNNNKKKLGLWDMITGLFK